MDLSNWLYLHRYPFLINGDDESIVSNPLQLFDQSQKTPSKGLILIRKPDPDVYDTFIKESIEYIKKLRVDGWYTIITTRDFDNVDFDEKTNMAILHKRILQVPRFKNPNYGDAQQQPGGGEQKEYIPKDQQIRLYKYRSEKYPSFEHFKTFFNEFESNKLTRHIKSKPLNGTMSGNITLVNADNFNDIILSNKNDVLLLYCTEWNQYCQGFSKDYEKIANHINEYYTLKGNKVLIAKMDLDGNDVDELRIIGVPTLIFYPKNSQTLFDGIVVVDKEMDSIIEVIQENAVVLKKEL